MNDTVPHFWRFQVYEGWNQKLNGIPQKPECEQIWKFVILIKHPHKVKT